MEEFKHGDKVIRIKCDCGNVTFGSKYIVEFQNGLNLALVGINGYYNTEYFKKCEEDLSNMLRKLSEIEE